MSQSRAKSLQEVIVNVGSGCVISYLLWLYVVPLVTGQPTGAGHGVAVTGIYTVASVARGYVVRRLYNMEKANGENV